MAKLALFIALGSAAVATVQGSRLEARVAQTSAICASSFAWMQNTMGASACQMASSVDAVCNNGNWIIGALNATVQYANPDATAGTTSPCICSWASYNLISACIACQGFPEQTPSWSVYSLQCSPADLTTNSFFPANITLPSSTAIPFWAQQNPMTKWTDGKFTSDQAYAVWIENKSEFAGGSALSTVNPKKTNIGAIVGGIIGGLIVLAGAVMVAFWMIRRQRRGNSAASLAMNRPTHGRGFSDASNASAVRVGHGYAPMMSNAPTSPTVTSSLRSMPFFSTMMSGTTSPPPVPSRQTGSTPTPREEMINPYTLPPTVDNPDRKQANGPQTNFDQPFAPPPMRVESTRTPTPPRGRYNPPAYTPSSPGGSIAPLPRHSRKQPSTDTQHSLTSSRNGGYTHSPNASGSGVANLAGQANALQEEGSRAQHGRTLSGESRDEKTRPTNSFSASDIA